MSMVINFDSEDPIATANACLEENLDSLQSAGVLHRGNKMSIAELVDSPLEIFRIGDVSDDDIFSTVTEAWRNDGKDLVELGADDVDDSDDDTQTISHPEALHAALLLWTYTKQMDSAFAWKMEATLARFGRETCHQAQVSLRSSTLDSYFKKVS
ncbi:uncharacterized protein EI90DRAFT_3115046 [Cantharellus anzutake]|uniref:uncharacterized protein n=1 Tax=Cantharellus anzutake TaxID=1750568 RepID=UPI0019068033|nr:uncharacterized protein EI90DRAFT_3115046 [Cantharellus anzutake]KAF8344294.1 hypothetical protein EI90DRAFT_3115046 [Cantharellus anzutake]